MTCSSEPTSLRRDLRAITGDGIAFSVMVGVGETYLPAFALAGGLGAMSAGLVATLPTLAGAVLQLVTPAASRRLGSYRRWVVLCARLQALSFVPLVLSAVTGVVSPAWLFLCASLYWGFGMATSPAWNAWVGAIVPRQLRATFFAHRARWAQTALFAGLMAGGFLLEGGRGIGEPLALFAALFTVAIGARWISAAYLARQSEPPGLVMRHHTLAAGDVARRLFTGGSGRLLAYLLASQAAVNVVAPFFTPFMLGPLALSYAEFTILTAAALLARIVALPFLGRIAHRRGSGIVLKMGAVGIVLLPALWLVSDAFAYLFVLQIASGTAWAALEFATLLAFFEGIDERERASILTVYNLANTVAIAAGALLGSALFGAAGRGFAAYAVLMIVSSGLRFASLALLRRIPSVAAPPETIAVRTLAVRPSLGAVQRPILATLEPEEEQEAVEPGAGQRLSAGAGESG